MGIVRRSGLGLQVPAGSIGKDELAPIINTDGHDFIPASAFEAILGTWTGKKDGIGDSIMTKRRTAGASDGIVTASLRLPNRNTAARGRKLVSYDMVYKLTTATCTNVLAYARLAAIPANGVAMTYATLAGGVDGDYDTPDHDSDTDRGALGNHTLTVTVGTPIYLTALQAIIFEVRVFAVATPTAVFDLVGIQPHYDETLVP